MQSAKLRLSTALLVWLACPSPARAAAPVLPAPRLQGLSHDDASKLIGVLADGQRAVSAGNNVYFELLSGAPAAYPATLVSPRQAFLAMHFEHPDVVEKLDAPNALWRPYRLTYFGKKRDELMWEVDVVLGYGDHLERVELLYKPPPPF